MGAKMLRSSWDAYNKNEQRGQDWLTGSTKKSLQKCMFKESGALWGDEPPNSKPIARAHSAIKRTELIGSNPAREITEAEARRN